MRKEIKGQSSKIVSVNRKEAALSIQRPKPGEPRSKHKGQIGYWPMHLAPERGAPQDVIESTLPLIIFKYI